MRKYGMPYQGSKSAIAEWVVSCLPPGDVFVDLFCGGCAVTHAALALHKYRRAIINDMNPMMPRAFADAIAGKFHDDYRWISREDFFRLNGKDEYAAICFSFGNNLMGYLYSNTIEPYKRACHYAIVFGEWSEMQRLCPDVADTAYQALEGVSDRHERRVKFGPAILRRLKEIGDAGLIDSNPLYSSCLTKEDTKTRPKGTIKDLRILQSLERLERIQNLERLQGPESLQGLIEYHTGDYRDVTIPPGAVVYCDPPYFGTKKYSAVGDFDHAAFYDWLLSRDYPVFVSEYNMPDDFAPIAIKQKTGIFNSKVVNYVAEKVFVQRRYADNFKRDLFL